MTQDPTASAGLLRERVRQIAEQARSTNAGRAAELRAALERADPSWSADQRSAAAAISHQLAGSAGTFGYLRVSDLARTIETSLLATDQAVQPAGLLEVLDQLDVAMSEGPDDDLD